MIIKKILNNNVVVTEDEKGNEIIAMGRGIAFGKYCGDGITEELIDKIYRLSNNAIFKRFQNLSENFSEDYIKVSDEIIEMAEKNWVGNSMTAFIFHLRIICRWQPSAVWRGLPLKICWIGKLSTFTRQNMKSANGH